ncbi:hypothetical protein ACN082_09895 [Rothia sp. CCM 9417]|uniref:hypothetical protein n=1 Tax=Rothia sp. CCM 9417 TaxID=3402657 RepID=UPI003AEB0DF8
MTTTYTPELHARLRELHQQASPAPWESSNHGPGKRTYIEHPDGDVLNHDERGTGHEREDIAWVSEEDGRVIVEYRNAVPALIADHEATARKLAIYEKRMAYIAENYPLVHADVLEHAPEQEN